MTRPGNCFPNCQKDTSPFIQHGETNLETRLELMEGFTTPNELFFVRNNSVSIDVDPAEYRLVVEGDAVETPVELTYQELRGLSNRTLFSYVECGGNQRGMFDLVKGEPARGAQWGTGGISNASWTGVPLRDVLALAGV